MSKRICPQEDIGLFPATGQMYNKLRNGCGWTGSEEECETHELGPWNGYRCPNCRRHTEDLEYHMAKMKGKPPGWVSDIPTGYMAHSYSIKFCPHCGERL